MGCMILAGSVWASSGSLLPNEIVAARRAHLANVSCAARIYAARCLHVGRPGAADHFRSHRQFALRPDSSAEPVTGWPFVMDTTSRDVKRPRLLVRTHPRLPIVRRIHLVDSCRRDQPICSVECCLSRSRRSSLCVCRGDNTPNSGNRYQPDAL